MNNESAQENQATMPSGPLRVILVDDDDDLRRGTANLLSRDPRVHVCATARDGHEVLSLLQAQAVDVVLLDVEMPGLNGVETTQRLIAKYPEIKIVMFTAFEVKSRLSQAIAAGAKGFLTKDMAPRHIVDSLLQVHEGGSVLDPHVTDSVFDALRFIGDEAHDSKEWDAMVAQLSSRLLPVYNLLIEGRTNREIADEAGLSESSVRTYVSRILEHFGYTSRTALAVQASRFVRMQNPKA